MKFTDLRNKARHEIWGISKYCTFSLDKKIGLLCTSAHVMLIRTDDEATAMATPRSMIVDEAVTSYRKNLATHEI